MNAIILLAMIGFILLCIHKALAPEPVHFEDAPTRPRPLPTTLPLPWYVRHTTYKVLHSRDQFEDVNDQSSWFIG